MVSDVGTLVWKELREMRVQQQGSRLGNGWVRVAIMLAVFGVYMPLQFGAGWVSTSVSALVAWAWVPMLLITGVVAEAFAGERERHTLESLLATRLSDRAILFGKIAAVIAYGWGITLVALLVGLVTTNVAHGNGRLLIYTPDTAFSVLSISFLVSVLTASAGVLLSLRAATVRQVQQSLGIGTMVIVFGSMYGLQALPVDWNELLGMQPLLGMFPPATLVVAALLTVVDVGLLLACMARFQRSRLILD
ncbi:MAG: ABC transporter permease subunit [Anaerolineae bacterium]